MILLNPGDALLPFQHIIARMKADPTGVLLVVGGLSDSFPAAYRNHPRIVIWGGTYEKRRTVEHRGLPRKTVGVVFTRFTRHAMTEGLRQKAVRAGAAFCPHTLPINTVAAICRASVEG